MRARRIVDGKDMVFFGSYGKNSDGTAKFYNPDNKHDNYSELVESVKDSIQQKLQVLRGELEYTSGYGLPLTDKIRNKAEMDIEVSSIILSTHNVQMISELSSTLSGSIYSANVLIATDFGEIEIEI